MNQLSRYLVCSALLCASAAHGQDGEPKGGSSLSMDVAGNARVQGLLNVAGALALDLVFVEASGQGDSLEVSCPAGMRMLSGGCASGQRSDYLSRSIFLDADTWECAWEGTEGGKSVVALCAAIQRN